VAEDKVASMRDAVAELVRDGDTLAIEGFTHLIGFAAGHEVIRQRKRDLTLCRLTPDVVYDQMIGAGVAHKLVFSWMGNPGVGSLHAIRRRVAIVHAQRADAAGDTQIWGLTGCQKEAAFAASRVIVVVEELVDEAVVRADPNRTLIPGIKVDAVVVCPRGAHPSYAQGYYDRDNRFYLEWDRISRDPETLDAWLDEWVRGTATHEEYVEKLGAERWAELTPAPALSGSVDYGDYR
jgi:acyl CoA:acetate/3-ketoacid CoA transferase alpha subunit